MAFKNTIVTRGRARGVATATGMATELGHIAEKLQPKHVATPLQARPAARRMNYLGFALFLFGGLTVLVVFARYGFSGDAHEIALYSISVAIAIIPEGLVAVLTVTMAIGVRRMAKKRAVVRKLNSLEALGAVTDICSDKTGTLTQGRMVAVALDVAGERLLRVTGAGIAPVGEFLEEGDAAGPPVDAGRDAALRLALHCAALCNNATLSQAPGTAPGPDAEGPGQWVATGDPTEVALVVLAAKAGVSRDALLAAGHGGARVAHQYDFDSTLKRMSVAVVGPQPGDPVTVFTKGAAEVVLRLCSARAAGPHAQAVSVRGDAGFLWRTLARAEAVRPGPAS
eukprot:tig00000857_g4938.t1